MRYISHRAELALRFINKTGLSYAYEIFSATPIPLGSLWQIINRLRSQGLIEIDHLHGQDSRPLRKMLKITEQGREYLRLVEEERSRFA